MIHVEWTNVNLNLCGLKRIKSNVSISDNRIWFRFWSWSKMTTDGQSMNHGRSARKFSIWLAVTKYDKNHYDWAIEKFLKCGFLIGYWSFLTTNTKPIADFSDNLIFQNQKNSKKDFIQFGKFWMHVLDFIWSISIYNQILDPHGCLFNIIPYLIWSILFDKGQLTDFFGPFWTIF